MSKLIKDNGEYAVKETGEAVSYAFEFAVYDSIADAETSLGKDKVLANLNRISKSDANNTAREKAKVVNGHSSRKPMSAEQKAESKAKRKSDKELLDIIKSKGLSIEDLRNV